MSAAEDISDLDKRAKEGVTPYNLLVGEFELQGGLVDHLTMKGVYTGKSNKKGEWKHKYSDFGFTWHHKLTKPMYDTSTIWKAANAVMKKGNPGTVRLLHIMNLTKKRSAEEEEGLSALKFTREEDMPHRVRAVLATVGTKQPSAIFDNRFMQSYLNGLEPRHRVPYLLERNRIVEVVMDYAMMEFKTIVNERRGILGEAFMGGNTDFWTAKHRCQAFGAFDVDLLAEKYQVHHGNGTMEVFMSRATQQRLDKTIFLTEYPVLSNMEFILNFEKFDGAKTSVDVAEWMDVTRKAAGIESSDFHQLSADGASNAIGSIAEFEALTRSERANDVDFDICYAHQNQRSGGYASGTLKFKLDPNPDLGSALKKNHGIQSRVHGTASRLAVYSGCATDAERFPIIYPKMGVPTRWDSYVEECKRANLIMGDMSKTLAILLQKGGMDWDLLSDEEKKNNDTSSFEYSDEEKKILRQYEGAAMPAREYSKFLQDNRNAWSYVLFETRVVLSLSSAEQFCIHRDVSHMDRTVDL